VQTRLLRGTVSTSALAVGLGAAASALAGGPRLVALVFRVPRALEARFLLLFLPPAALLLPGH
jgi:hypothetical protein